MAAILWYHIMAFCVRCQRTVSHFLMSRVLSVHWMMTLSRWWAHWAWVRGNPCQTQSSLRSPTRSARVWWPVQTAAVPWWVRMLIFFRFCPVLFGYWVCNWYCFMTFSAVVIVFLCLHLTSLLCAEYECVCNLTLSIHLCWKQTDWSLLNWLGFLSNVWMLQITLKTMYDTVWSIFCNSIIFTCTSY